MTTRVTVSTVESKVSDMQANIASAMQIAEREGMIESAMNWYNNAHSVAATLAIKFNVSVDVVAAIIAVLSPMIYWIENLIDTYELLNESQDHRFSAYGRNVDKALEVLYSGNTSLASSIKVSNFFLSILRPENSDSVTVDIWTLRQLLDDYFSDRKELYKYFNTSGKQAIIIGLIKSEAAKYNMTGSQLQSVIWAVAQYRGDRKRDHRDHEVVTLWESFVNSLPG